MYKMYLMHNGEKYAIHQRHVLLDIDEYNEIYFVTNNYNKINRRIDINYSCCCDIRIAYHHALLNKTIKIIDDEFFIPIRKFIGGIYYVTAHEHYDENEIHFWNLYWMEIPKDIKKITLYMLIYKKGMSDTIDIFHNNVKKYDFDHATFMIAETDESDLCNLDQKIAIYHQKQYNIMFLFHHIENN